MSEPRGFHTHADGTCHIHDHTEGQGHTHTHSHTQTRAVINRLARAIGHLESVRRMVESGRDCTEVLMQLAAVQSALRQQHKNLHLLANTRDRWLGVTYAEDTEMVEKFLTEQTSLGRYPRTFNENCFGGNSNETECD